MTKSSECSRESIKASTQQLGFFGRIMRQVHHFTAIGGVTIVSNTICI
jgi:hypothetical protein